MNDGIGFWQGFFLLLIFIPVAMCWVFALMDLFRRDDLSGWMVAFWIFFLLILPILGVLIYFIARPVTVQDVAMQEEYRKQVDSDKAEKAADRHHKLSDLKARGDLTQEEFDKQKAKLLG